MNNVMATCAVLRRTIGPIAPLAVVASLACTPAMAMQQPAATPKPLKGVIVRGCLAGSKLTKIDVDDAPPTLPDILRVSTIRVIRNQLKALDGHEVELIGTLSGVPGQENGLLVVDSDTGRGYRGGGDSRVVEDANRARTR